MDELLKEKMNQSADFSNQNIDYDPFREILDDPSLPLVRRLEVIMNLDKVNTKYGIYNSFIKSFSEVLPYKGDQDFKIKTLEVGAGLGGLSREVFKWGLLYGYKFDINLYDTQADILSSAQQLLELEGIKANCHVATQEHLKAYPDNSFDYIISLHVIHHIRPINEAASALSEMMRVAKRGVCVLDFHRKPGSVFLFKVWNRFFGINQDLSDDGVKSMQRAYDPAELDCLLSKLSSPNLHDYRFVTHKLKPYWEFQSVKLI